MNQSINQSSCLNLLAWSGLPGREFHYEPATHHWKRQLKSSEHRREGADANHSRNQSGKNNDKDLLPYSIGMRTGKRKSRLVPHFHHDLATVRIVHH